MLAENPKGFREEVRGRPIELMQEGKLKKRTTGGTITLIETSRKD